MFGRTKKIKSPSALLVLLEGRAFYELGGFIAASPLFKHMPKGDGHPVLVLPGFTASDRSTKPLRRALSKCGYITFGWMQGTNLGLRDQVLERMLARVDEIYDLHNKKISIVGWSLGGIFARELAKLRPKKIRLVITLGSPHSGDPRASNAYQLYEFMAGHSVDNPPIKTRMDKAPPVPTTSVYTKTDGIVAWQNCHQQRPVNNHKARHNENICVTGSHCGLGVNPSVLYIIADRLAQEEGNWKPFTNTGARKMFFRTPAFEAVPAFSYPPPH